MLDIFCDSDNEYVLPATLSRDHRQTSLLMLRKLINFYSHSQHQKTNDLLVVIFSGIEVKFG